MNKTAQTVDSAREYCSSSSIQLRYSPLRATEVRRLTRLHCVQFEGLIGVRGQLPSSLREKVLYQHVSIYLHALVCPRVVRGL
jgi:hypothetical protein